MKFIDPRNDEGICGYNSLWIKECAVEEGETLGDGSEWQAKVYRPKHKNAKYDRQKWLVLRQKVLKRDGYKCKNCKSNLNLSAHHIISQADGGKDIMKNLETLCEKCHNAIEIGELPVIDDKPTGRDWHEWVYGGSRKPAY
jgi:hypothetical protein